MRARRLTEDARQGLRSLGKRAAGEDGRGAERERLSRRVPGAEHEVELRRDRRGEHWILLAPRHAPLARVLAGRAGLRALEGPVETLALAAVESEAAQIAELIDQLEPATVEPRVADWLRRCTEWRGTIEVAGSQEEPLFLLLGDFARLPSAVREHARGAPGGATVPLTRECWQAMEGRLRGWMSPAAKRCVAALREGRPAPPAVLELSPIHEDPTFVLAPGHQPGQLEDFASLPGVLPEKPGRGAGEHGRLPAIHADPFCVPALDEFLATHGTWVAPDALALLQEVREQHAHSAGLVELSAATDAPLQVPGLGGQLKPFQRAGISYLLSQRRAFPRRRAGARQDDRGARGARGRWGLPGHRRLPREPQAQLVARDRALAARAQYPRARGERKKKKGGGGGGGETQSTTRGMRTGGRDHGRQQRHLLSARLAELRAIEPRALVLDESHYCKNAAAKRTQAAQRLAAGVRSWDYSCSWRSRGRR